MPSKEWNRLDDEVRDTLIAHQLDLPIRLSTIAKAVGVAVKASTLPAGISGEIRPSDRAGEFVIRVNRHDGSRRQRFTIAHEISHFLLHRDQIGRGISDDALYRSSLSDSREAEANRLAADILMPESLLQIELSAARQLGVDDIVGHLAERFDVSEAAMRIRLGIG